MTRSNRKKNEQLGIPYGTAMNRLRKMVLFQLLYRLGENVCHQCGLEIRTYQELSIEHKEPWLDGHPDLFWDLDNIAFSHLSCNAAAGRKNPTHKKHCPEGQAWCSKCQACVEVDRFGRARQSDHRTALRAYCNDCRKGAGWDNG